MNVYTYMQRSHDRHMHMAPSHSLHVCQSLEVQGKLHQFGQAVGVVEVASGENDVDEVKKLPQQDGCHHHYLSLGLMHRLH